MADNSKDSGLKSDPNNHTPERIDFSVLILVVFFIVCLVIAYSITKP